MRNSFQTFQKFQKNDPWKIIPISSISFEINWVTVSQACVYSKWFKLYWTFNYLVERWHWFIMNTIPCHNHSNLMKRPPSDAWMMVVFNEIIIHETINFKWHKNYCAECKWAILIAKPLYKSLTLLWLSLYQCQLWEKWKWIPISPKNRIKLNIFFFVLW